MSGKNINKIDFSIFEKINSSFDSQNNESFIGYLLPEKKKIAVYGFGQGFKTFKQFVLDKFGLKPDLIIDKKFDNNSWELGVEAVNMSAKSLSSLPLEQFVVVITIGNINEHQQIIAKLKKIGFTIILSAFDFYEYHLSHAEKDIVYAQRDYYRINKQKIDLAYLLLSDEESRKVYSEILLFYMSKKIIPITCRPLDEQYLSHDIICSKKAKRLVNCGAFNGDTLMNFHSKLGKMDFVLCLEPDIKNFQELTSWLKKMDNNGTEIADEVLTLPLGLGKETTYVHLKSNGTNSSLVESVSNNSDLKPLLCTKLDDILFNKDIGFINMDIEGSELDALKGARRVITNAKPDLAISIYHKPSDLWEIILFISKICSDYRFSIRNYTGFPAETVLYATL